MLFVVSVPSAADLGLGHTGTWGLNQSITLKSSASLKKPSRHYCPSSYKAREKVGTATLTMETQTPTPTGTLPHTAPRQLMGQQPQSREPVHTLLPSTPWPLSPPSGTTFTGSCEFSQHTATLRNSTYPLPPHFLPRSPLKNNKI